jgi:enoyl-CoA hydratase/carnithine racemase
MAEETMLSVIEGGVALITLDRPAVLNALDVHAAEALVAPVQHCAAQEVRAVILTCSGRIFVPGET